MIEAPPLVLITRPADSAADFSSRVECLGCSTILSPLIEHEATGNDLPAGPFSTVVVTSRTALRYVDLDALTGTVPLVTVGERTAEACREMGVLHAECGGETVEALVETMAIRRQALAGKPVLYLSGTRVSHDLAVRLRPLGIMVVRVPVYASRDCRLSPDAIHHLCDGSIAWITLFSRHTAAVLAREIGRLGVSDRTGGIALACLAPEMAQEVAQFRWRRVEVAAQPNEAALLACLAKGTTDGERGANER